MVLSRFINEDILVGDDIVIKVVGVLGGKVRIGITAPVNVPIHRREVYEAIKREEEQKGNSDVGN